MLPWLGETINNFITRLEKLAEHCEYEGERDNQVRDRAISFIKDRNLKSKLYREETRFVKRKQKQFRSSAKSIQNKKKFFVSVDGIVFTSTFSKFLIEYVL